MFADSHESEILRVIPSFRIIAFTAADDSFEL